MRGAGADPGGGAIGYADRAMSPYARAFVVLVLILAAWGPSALGQRVLFLTHSAGFCHEVVKRPSPEVLSFAELELTAASRRGWATSTTGNSSRSRRNTHRTHRSSSNTSVPGITPTLWRICAARCARPA